MSTPTKAYETRLAWKPKPRSQGAYPNGEAIYCGHARDCRCGGNDCAEQRLRFIPAKAPKR